MGRTLLSVVYFWVLPSYAHVHRLADVRRVIGNCNTESLKLIPNTVKQSARSPGLLASKFGDKDASSSVSPVDSKVARTDGPTVHQHEPERSVLAWWRSRLRYHVKLRGLRLSTD